MHPSWAVLIIILGMFGCETSPDPQGGAYAGSPCSTCQAAACSAPLEACGADNDCAPYLWCLGACPRANSGRADAACEARCAARVPTGGRARMAAVQSCQGTGAGAVACAAECGAPPSLGIAFFNQQCTGPASGSPCKVCTEQRCCESRAGCFGNARCDPLYDCMQACPADERDPDFGPCRGRCQKTYRDAGAEYARLDLCAKTRCQTSCTVAPDACLACQARYCGDALLQYRTQQSCIDGTYCKYQCAAGDSDCHQRCVAAVADCVRTAAWPLVICADKFCPDIC